jgi:adenosylhomocysteine/aminodeoxyfutalosine nucleosidase
MVPAESVLLAVAADPFELSGFRSKRAAQGFGVRGYWADWSGEKALMLAGGIGRGAARRAVVAALQRVRVSCLISVGYVGATRPEWSPGDIFLPDRIVLLEEGLEYACTWPVFEGGGDRVRRGALATIDHVAATAAEKRRLAARGADAVDMEAFEVALQAEELGLPFFCVRVVSDAAETDLGFDFDRARRHDGSVSAPSIVAQAGLSPARWRKLLKLKRNGDLAARNLAQFLLQCRFPLESNP